MNSNSKNSKTETSYSLPVSTCGLGLPIMCFGITFVLIALPIIFIGLYPDLRIWQMRQTTLERMPQVEATFEAVETSIFTPGNSTILYQETYPLEPGTTEYTASCISAASYYIYGSNQSYELVIENYHNYFLNTHWKVDMHITPDGKIVTFFSKIDISAEVYIYKLKNLEDVNSLNFEIEQDLLNFRGYPTIYYLSYVFRDCN